jgi:hypothetical protein
MADKYLMAIDAAPVVCVRYFLIQRQSDRCCSARMGAQGDPRWPGSRILTGPITGSSPRAA